MKWGDQKRDFHPILAVWPEYRPRENWWHMIEYAESEPHKPAWRDRRVPSPDGGVRADIYRDDAAAIEAASTLNPTLAQALEERALDEETRASLRLKLRKALEAKERLSSEEELMLKEGIRRHANDPRPLASDLELPIEAEDYRDALAKQLFEMPYLRSALIATGHTTRVLYRQKGLSWTKPYSASRRSAQEAYRARTANAYDLNGSDHWGKTKGKIREILLPRANQLLKLASVQRLLDEALQRGERVLVAGDVVFWYESDGSVGWQIKSVAPSEDKDGTAIWKEGSILSKNHGRIVVLPYIKEDGETVSGHTKNVAGDGPAKPRHPDHFVTLPFRILKSDLMIGLFGELPYE